MNSRNDIKPFEKRIWLATPTMHGVEQDFVKLAFDTNWVTTAGENINQLEKIAAKEAQRKYAVAVCNCTAALHLACKLAGEKLYGKSAVSHGSLEGKRVFCSDMTFAATLNPVTYEGGIPIFIDTDINSWNMDPVALERAFELYPDVKLVVYAELYGFSGDIQQIRKICDKHGAILIEDAAEAMGASVNGKMCGSFGDFAAVSYNGNKIITGSSGGCLLTDSHEDAARAKTLSTQAREAAPWYQHIDVGYNYRMSNLIAGVIRGQYQFLNEHIEQKKKIYLRYKEGLKGLPIVMNPVLDGVSPNYWLSALIVNRDAMCKQVRSDNDVTYRSEHGKSCPTEILEALESINAEGRPIWKPMHMQPMYRIHQVIGRNGNLKGLANEDKPELEDVGADIFQRGCCLPSDNKMTPEEQDKIIEVIRACFD